MHAWDNSAHYTNLIIRVVINHHAKLPSVSVKITRFGHIKPNNYITLHITLLDPQGPVCLMRLYIH